MEEDDVSVRVAVRIRPQIPREIIDMCRMCTQVITNEPQVVLGADKAFTYDYVFDTDVTQDAVYETCVSSLISGALDGYNATVFAYGQTGSGKTYTMGTGFGVDVAQPQQGIIPRAVLHLFQSIEQRIHQACQSGSVAPKFKISAQFLELYNEEVIDLFNPIKNININIKGKGYKINEDPDGAIHIKGVTVMPVRSFEDAMQYLKTGALSRTTASTQMNAQSSRSHAIFTLFIKQERLVSVNQDSGVGMDLDVISTEPTNEFETLTAKFHFVDLAGSERLKRTGATGERAKEGIAINCGLLALGNVISALGDKAKKALHVPYRDSKLTRLLQDSLGGNSHTVMIACISPSDRDFMETLNTLKYANRARNIKNRVTVNQDTNSRKLNLLKQQIAQLQLELLDYKQGKRILEQDGTETINDMFYENNMLQSELNNLRTRVKALQETIDALNAKNLSLLIEKESEGWINTNPNIDVTTIIQAYLQEIEDLRAKLLESNYMCEQLRKVVKTQEHFGKSITSTAPSSRNTSRDSSFVIIEEARKEIIREKEMLERSKNECEELNSDSSDKESDSELDSENEDKVNMKLQVELVNLTTDIDMKEKLIKELELSQQRLQVMRQHYEEKLLQLNVKIKDTQEERDKVLQSFVGQYSEPSEKIQRIRQDYEKKIQDMQKEMKRLQAAQKEHARLLKNQMQHETQLRTLKTELNEMKRVKVKLLNKMKEESQKHRDAETKRIREIAQLRKESVKNANVIRSMEAERRVKEQVLRRKQEEVFALKKEKQHRLSLKASGRVGQRYLPKIAKQKWTNLENMMNKFSIVKQSLAEQDLRMEQLLEKRNVLGKDLEKYQSNRVTLLTNKQGTYEVDNLIEDLTANINYVQDTISETQHNVMEIEESQDLNEITDITQSVIDINEARYLIQKLVNMTMNQSYTIAQRDAKLKENEAHLYEMKQEVNLRSQLLDHMLHSDQDGFGVSFVTSYSSNANESEVEISSTATSRSSSPVDNSDQKIKIRKRTALPQELLFGKMKPDDIVKQDDIITGSGSGLRTQTEQDHIQTIKVPVLSETTRRISFMRAYSTIDKQTERKVTVPTSPKTSQRIALHHSTKHGSLEEGLDQNSLSPLNSPLTLTASNKSNSYGIGRDENVFSRLTASTLQTDIRSIPGNITPYDGKNQANNSGIQCVFVAAGHNSSVLSVCATDDLLFTGAADRTVKVWDLEKGIEKQTLAGHPNNVVAVRYLPANRILLSASLAFVKVWDLRTPCFQCVQILCSSGMTQSGTSLSVLSSNRRVQMPVGESQINDVIFNSTGDIVCTASSGKAKLWDLRKLSPIAILNSGHQAAIMCLACERFNSTNDFIITGSKDHYIKVFTISPMVTGSVSPSLHLEPPHYDGIQSLAVGHNILFSGSRDMCIKKWDLNKKTLVQSISNAHKNWICGLTLIQDNKLLLSGCRNGYLKLWDARTCNQMNEIKAHNSSINAVTTNSTHLFTASNSGEVKLWKYE